MPVPLFVGEVEVAIDDPRAQVGIITRIIGRIDFLDIVKAMMRFHRFFVVSKRDQQESIKNKQQKQDVMVFIFQCSGGVQGLGSRRMDEPITVVIIGYSPPGRQAELSMLKNDDGNKSFGFAFLAPSMFDLFSKVLRDRARCQPNFVEVRIEHEI